MTLKSILLGAALSLSALPALAEINIQDPYARASSPAARVGAAFMVISNSGDEDDRLISVSSDAAKRIELHTHVITDGVAKMMEVEEGFVVPAHGEVLLQRGGYHVMMMGLTAPFVQGETITLNLVFENAGAQTLVVIIDSERQDEMNHETMEGMSDN
ncbi:MAG: copper chaperone PCu(A)C [Rhodobacteraceae bacterium]|nr:copper chaperone PCu(A)C [Paracoccaceae bacterium]